MNEVSVESVLQILQSDHPLVFENCVLKARLQSLTNPPERITADEDEGTQ